MKLRFKQSLESVEETKKQEIAEKEKIIFMKDKEIEHYQEKVVLTEGKINQLENTVRIFQQAGSKEDPKIIMLEKTVRERTDKVETLSTQNKTLMERNAELNKKVLISTAEVE